MEIYEHLNKSPNYEKQTIFEENEFIRKFLNNVQAEVSLVENFDLQKLLSNPGNNNYILSILLRLDEMEIFIQHHFVQTNYIKMLLTVSSNIIIYLL